MSKIIVKLDRPLTGVTVIHPEKDAVKPAAVPTVIPTSQPPAVDTSELLAQIAAGIDEANQQTNEAISGLSELAIRFAMAITARVIGSSEAIEQQRLELMINEALSRHDTPVAIYLHPSRMESIQEAMGEQFADGNVSIVSDSSVPNAECRIQYASHELVSNLTHQFSQIEIEILDIIGHARL